MDLPIRLSILEKSIEECICHLNFLKGSSSINEEIINFIKSTDLEKSILDNITTGSELSNIHCIVTSTELEISIILKSLYHSSHQIESKQILKNGVLLIYETIKTLDKFGEILYNLSIQYSQYKTEYLSYQKGMKSFKKNIELDSTYKDIRNKIAGHIVPDYSEYSRIIDTIDIDNQKYYMVQFRMLIDSLNTFLFKCYEESNTELK